MTDIDATNEEIVPLTANDGAKQSLENDEKRRKQLGALLSQDNMSEELKQLCNDHEKGVQECVKIFRNMALLSILMAFDYSMRSNIVLLYLKSMKHNVPEHKEAFWLGFVIYISYVFAGIASLITGIINCLYIK